ncbi:ABC transporter ATP-binding protein [Hespellia stercorisuis]|uniref:ABC-2 type transport system ATP-binding protein n=1 Tax=Hespellia stercorisuis DSM 15480 TaxID=1121950 RepID=A0A1M6TZU1_9FIRM|nr:ABC transporter ATP-binding protein [Hespellia stercorisuis]SHK62466.1 ABC-2 type transport system ATP-binding protein [Hespellia stercorisuis DSM 15480]
MKTIEIEHITKDYGQHRGVFDLSFDVRKGEVLGFLGPNGAGKTTTIRQLLGFIKPDQGKVNILGKDCFEQADEIKKSLGYLPGEIAFIDSMSGMEFIRFVAKMKKMKDLGRAQELMEQFELNANGKLKKMSKGMKQKIGIVCAFMQDPDILILDEPTSGLDPLMQNRFVELILSEKRRGKTILMSSHIFEEVERTCDRAVIIRGGELVAVDTMESLCSGKQKRMEITFADTAMAAGYVSGFAKAVQDEQDGRRVTMKVGRDIDEAVKKAGAFTVVDLNVHTQSLEDFFLHFYGGDQS